MKFSGRSVGRFSVASACLLGALTLGACSSLKAPKPGPAVFQSQSDEPGWNPFAGRRAARPSAGSSSGELGVNGYLWRASLDTLAFMPLASADPYGGLIITDWYTVPERPTERFKATVYILDTRLRADGLNVSVFKQVRDAAGQWVDAPSSPQTETDIENSILTRARQLKLANISG
jgi:hypothetical protein